MLKDLEPHLSTGQATCKWNRIHKAFMSTGDLSRNVVAQKTNSKRCAITVQGQWM